MPENTVFRAGITNMLALEEANEIGRLSMPLAQAKVYTEEDYYGLPEHVRAELVEGDLIYNQAAPPRIFRAETGSF